ncbi:unnamed protein product [Calypogeia fissa]
MDNATTNSATMDSSTTQSTATAPVGNVSASSRRNAIVTGVARKYGIVWSIVREFVDQGYRVLGADIQDLEFEGQAKLYGLSSEDFHFVKADISDPLQAKLIVERGMQWFGPRINVLINNAGRTKLGDNSMESFAITIAVNLNGAYYMTQCVVPYMPPGTSSIIHMSSTRALQSEPDTEAYSASKAGLLGLTHSQAITLAGKVRVNAVLPGWINTDPSEEALRPEDHAWHPAGRVGVPKDVADFCLFLCDDRRAGFITGQEFVIDGGTTKKMVYPEE